MDEVAAARQVASRLRAAVDDVRFQRVRPRDLATELVGLAEEVDGLAAELERRLVRARDCRPPPSGWDHLDNGLVSEGLSLLEDFRLIPRPDLRRSVLALVHALSPDASRARPHKSGD